jgi:hypothetical protein
MKNSSFFLRKGEVFGQIKLCFQWSSLTKGKKKGFSDCHMNWQQHTFACRGTLYFETDANLLS